MTVTHLIPDKIITVENFLTEQECNDFIDLGERLGFERAKIDTGSLMPEVRNNDRAFYENVELAEKLFQRLKLYVVSKIGNSVAVGLNELFRLYKYQKGQQFKGHQDGSFIRNDVEASYYTFLVYLNDNYQGGETIFLKHKISPKTGMGLIFLHKLYHEGSEVLSGTKYVMRSDVMYRLEQNNG
jgi:prolyl 4-hydroxylase